MRKFGRNKDHREHMVRNLATSLLLYETIETTMPKAKEVKTFVDRLLSRAKGSDFNTIRLLNTELFDRNAVTKVVEELNPRYIARSSGFVRSFHLKNRLGDNSAMMRLELVDKKVFVKKAKNDKTIEPTEPKTEEVVVKVKETVKTKSMPKSK